MIEKDILQSAFLFRLSKTDFPLVFKRGTSLSKAYKIIDRFSEDIDLSSSRKLTSSEKKRLNQSIMETAKELSLRITNADNIKSRYDYNKYVFPTIPCFRISK